MKQTLMTPEELKERYKPKLALALSIEKHKRARLKKNWSELHQFPNRCFGSSTCALCKKYKSPVTLACGKCVLLPEDRYVGCGLGSHWINAREAIRWGDREKFLKHSLALIKEMEEHLPKRKQNV